MKIVVIPSWYPNDRLHTQGAFFRDQALALSETHEVDVIYCHREKYFSSRTYADEGVNTHYWNYRLRLGSFLGMLGRILIFLLMFTFYYRKNKPGLIHCHSVAFNQNGAAGIAGILIGAIYSIPVIITEHATVFATKNYSFLEKKLMQWALNKADTVIAVSVELKQHLFEFCGRVSIEVIPNTLDVNKFNPSIQTRKLKNDHIKMCSIGYLMHKKGFDRLINVIFLLKKRKNIHVKLDIIGDGPEKAALMKMVAKLGLTDSISFLGEMSKNEVARVLPNYDIFILLSRVETFGVVFIEALACGLYCIGTQCGGPEYILDDTRLGVIFKNSDIPSDYVEELSLLLLNKSIFEFRDYRFSVAENRYSFTSFRHEFYDKVIKKYEL
ncbi:glycosyltransferase family 4 protein [Hafnia alvei]|uniref:N-acetyl-alpha-D-glucosaminyl L-malate synthase n=1 Tax=Hafnia alvei TaxID=569 RepID=A0A172WZU1_HAFAL|nr:glycosyltransferase [Hafnia alvei]ANF29885.1 N-acetyl-alpha-D-glucosaminyl L-malate synthase [Hafnia alvei]MBW3477334.1 glycosyltransferase [Hafnia alvei]TBM10225.1 glycosyltransferase family 4 protein [Hafnia alvei]